MFNSTNNRNRKAYGKRRHARDRIIDSCFVSSPLKEMKTIEIREDSVIDLLEKLRLDNNIEKDSFVYIGAINTREGNSILSPRDPNQRRALRLSGRLSAKKDNKEHQTNLQDSPSLVRASSPATEAHRVDISSTADGPGHEDEQVPPPIPAHEVTRVKSSKTKIQAKTIKAKNARPQASPILLASSTPEIISHAQPLLSLCVDDHSRSAPLCFHAWADSLDRFFEVVKIAEASYGEVFRLSVLPGVTTSFSKGDESVLKLIALKAPPSSTESATQKRKQAAMSVVEHVASEVRMLRRMSPVPGFTNFRDIKVVQGRLPPQFVAAWKHYDQHVKKSLFPDPSKKASYVETQLWAVVEMQDAGTDLEGLLELEPQFDPEDLDRECPIPVWREINVWAAWDIFWTTAFAVAKGEGFAEFEHRDLHLGNICIRSKSSEATIAHLDPNFIPVISSSKNIGFTSLETTIIDYTLSRANMSSNLTAPAPDIAYLDLSADPALFEGEGDIDYQYDVYRHMRGEVLFSDCTITTPWKSPPPARKKPAGPRGKKVKPKESVDLAAMLDDMTLTESWQAYKPATNLIWLHFVLTKLIEVVLPPMSEASEDCEEWMPQQELAGQLYYRLMMLGEEKLTLESIKAGTWASVAEMVEWAVKEGWIGEEDVVGEGR